MSNTVYGGPRRSARQELGEFVGSGRLRALTEHRLSAEAVELLVVIVSRYCEPRRLAEREKP